MLISADRPSCERLHFWVVETEGDAELRLEVGPGFDNDGLGVGIVVMTGARVGLGVLGAAET